MSDLISRQAAIDAITNTGSMVAYHDASESVMFGSAFRQNEIIDIINALPSADRPTGKWLKRQTVGDADFAYCSECGEPIIHGRTSPLWSYCPNCGEKMKGETK